MRIIDVPDIQGPIKRLCWKQAPSMERCDRVKGHQGPHTWVWAATVDQLQRQIPYKPVDYEAEQKTARERPGGLA